MPTKLMFAALLAFSFLSACTKRPTADECERAVRRMVDVMDKEAVEQFRKSVEESGSVPVAGVEEHMKEAARQRESSPGWEPVWNAHIAACQRQPQTRALCVAGASSTEGLVNDCGMKPSQGGPRGGLTISWPD